MPGLREQFRYFCPQRNQVKAGSFLCFVQVWVRLILAAGWKASSPMPRLQWRCCLFDPAVCFRLTLYL